MQPRNSPEQETRENTAHHVLDVVREDGHYRHLRFRNPNWGITWGFDIISWPGHVTISGDLGIHTFRHTSEDALGLFRSSLDELGYIAQKAADGSASVKEWSQSAFHRELLALRDQWTEEFGVSADLNAAIESVIAEAAENPADAADTVSAQLDGVTFDGVQTDDDDESFSTPATFRMDEGHVHDCTKYRDQFVVQVTALLVGVRLYDQHTAERQAPVAVAA